jgi:hypothetical protein
MIYTISTDLKESENVKAAAVVKKSAASNGAFLRAWRLA